MFEIKVPVRPACSEFWILFICDCFEFRYSDFEFLDEIDLLALLQGHDGFLPPRPSSQGSPHTSLLAGVVAGVHVHDTLLKEPFHCVLDLNLVCLGTDAEDVLVLLLAHQRRFLRQRRGLNDLVRLGHLSCRSLLRRRMQSPRQLFESLLRDQNFLKAQQLLGVHIGSCRKCYMLHVSRGLERLFVK